MMKKTKKYCGWTFKTWIMAMSLATILTLAMWFSLFRFYGLAILCNCIISLFAPLLAYRWLRFDSR